MNDNFKQLEQRLGGHSLPNTSRQGEETVTVWYNQKTGEIYGAGAGNPRKKNKQSIAISLKYDTTYKCPKSELVSMNNIIPSRPLKRVLEQISYFRQMRKKALNISHS